MVQPPHVAAARGITLGLVFQRRAKLRRSLVPARVVVELELVAVGVAGAKGASVAEVAIHPAEARSHVLQHLHAAFQRLRAGRAESDMADAGRTMRGELQRMELV